VIRVAAQTLRARWASFLGTVAALVLAVAQVAAIGLLLMGVFCQPGQPPQRFASAPAVVQPDDPAWNAAQHDLGVRSLPADEGIPAPLLAKLAATGPTVVDRTFYAQLSGGPAGEVGHPWAAARFGGYRLTAGAPPASATQVVVDAGAGAVGQAVTVLTAAGAARYTVSGTVSPVGWERSVFFTET
jgi:putative ABC transport system permease protein